jgi:hypothetical protein
MPLFPVWRFQRLIRISEANKATIDIIDLTCYAVDLKKDLIPNTPTTPSVCPSDDPIFGSRGSASTPVENIAIIGYFEKRRDLIRKKPVNIAVLQCPPF